MNEKEALARIKTGNFNNGRGFDMQLLVDVVGKMGEMLNSGQIREVASAYWVEESDRQRHWHCSNCGTVQGITSAMMKYCPNCGAEMAEHPWAASGCGQTFSPGKDE